MSTPALDGKAVLFWGCLLPEDPEKKAIFGRMVYGPTERDHATLRTMLHHNVGIGWLRDANEEMHYYLAITEQHMRTYDGIPLQVRGFEHPETIGDENSASNIRAVLALLGEDPEKAELGLFLGCGLF